MDCSLVSSDGFLQARILEWVAISSFRGSSWPRDWTNVSYISCIDKQILYTSVTGKASSNRIVYWRGWGHWFEQVSNSSGGCGLWSDSPHFSEKEPTALGSKATCQVHSGDKEWTSWVFWFSVQCFCHSMAPNVTLKPTHLPSSLSHLLLKGLKCCLSEVTYTPDPRGSIMVFSKWLLSTSCSWREKDSVYRGSWILVSLCMRGAPCRRQNLNPV